MAFSSVCGILKQNVHFCAGLADSARSLKKSNQDVSHLSEKLNAVTLERNAAVEKLNGIQQLMAGYDRSNVLQRNACHSI